MKPICLSCEETLPISPREIARQILEVARWREFKGYGLLPAIRTAVFELETPEIVGCRIRVTNTDGSGHVEEIVEWQPDCRLQLNMREFSPPLSRLAILFEEIWEFRAENGGTHVNRSFRLHARSVFTRPLLWGISFLLKGAISRHLREMRQRAESTAT